MLKIREYSFLEPLGIDNELYSTIPRSYIKVNYKLFDAYQQKIYYNPFLDKNIIMYHNNQTNLFFEIINRMAYQESKKNQAMPYMVYYDTSNYYQKIIKNRNKIPYHIHKYPKGIEHLINELFKKIITLQKTTKDNNHRVPLLVFLYFNEKDIQELKKIDNLKKLYYLISNGYKEKIYFFIGLPTTENLPINIAKTINKSIFIGSHNSTQSQIIYPQAKRAKRNAKRKNIGVAYDNRKNTLYPIISFHTQDTSKEQQEYLQIVDKTMNSYQEYLQRIEGE